MLALVGLAPVHVELQTQRLKLFQAVARDPLNHQVLITAMFAKFDFEPDVYVHPWLLQLRTDLLGLSYIDDASGVLDAIGDNPLLLLYH